MKDFRPVARAALLTALGLMTCLPSASPAQAAVEIAPHRAIYKMSLASSRNNSTVSDVRGQMMFEWADACDGWTIEQRFQLRFQYSEGEQVDMSTNYATWEAKDGQTYRFNVRKLVNGELDEELRGTAEAHADRPGVARYVKPEEQEIELPGGTLFPSMHTIQLLRHAADGDKVFGTTVFDGSDTEGATEINTVMGLRKDLAQDKRFDSRLFHGKIWPVRMAFFPLASDDAAPEYEMGLQLLENGVAQSMLIDYGDFTVAAVLEQIESLPRPRC
ncbi:cell envelope integrity EipB family protein [Skermanella stibiiresistens]|uniref:cell envelope integrity EipB family protein n=1 Tax=Skermanella stibiiresistens TaxID=913326 RepID=UPI001FE0E12D|nr:cell envelope integrity EipB family protein [Skermanella stibiiresistens]